MNAAQRSEAVFAGEMIDCGPFALKDWRIPQCETERALHRQVGADQAERTTRQLLREAAPGDRSIVGITENVPEDRWRTSFAAILQTLNECGRLPIRPETF